MKNRFVNYIVAFSQNMLDLIMCLLLGLFYLFVRIVPIAVLTFWISVGIVALNGEREFMNMPIGRLALIGVAATIAAIILGVAAVTLLDSLRNTTEDNADTE